MPIRLLLKKRGYGHVHLGQRHLRLHGAALSYFLTSFATQVSHHHHDVSELLPITLESWLSTLSDRSEISRYRSTCFVSYMAYSIKMIEMLFMNTKYKYGQLLSIGVLPTFTL